MTVHTFANKGDGTVKLFVIDTPGGFENYNNDLQAAFDDGKDINADIIKRFN